MNGPEDRPVRPPVAPASVGETRAHRDHGTQGMAPVAVERREELLAVRGRALVLAKRVAEALRGRWSAAGRNGLLASTPDEWVDAVSSLIESVALRKRLAEEGRETVSANYTIERVAPLLLDGLTAAAR